MGKTFYCDGFKFDIFMFPMSLLPLSVFSFLFCFFSWVPNPVDGLLLIAAILTPQRLHRSVHGMQMLHTTFIFYYKTGLSNRSCCYLCSYGGLFQLLCSPDKWTMDNGHNLLHGHEGICAFRCLFCGCFFFSSLVVFVVCVYVCARVCFLSFFVMFA